MEAAELTVGATASSAWTRLREHGDVSPGELLRPELADLSRYHLDRSAVRFKLDQNEPPWELPESVRERVADRWIAERWSSYPDFHGDDLRAAIARYHHVTPAQVLVGNGSNELLALTLVALAKKDQVVLGLEPSFGLYRSFVAKAGGRFEGLRLGPQLELPMAQLLEAVRRDPSRPVLLCSPNNPTGGAATPEAIAELLQVLEAPLLLDNAYGEFCQYDYRPLLAQYPHLVLFRTFSKAWALAASRVGYLLAHPTVVEALIRVKLPYNLDRFSAVAAEEALAAAPWVEARVAELVASRARWSQQLERGGVEVFASEANFLLVRAKGGPAAAKELFLRLAAGGLLVRDVGSYSGLEGCLRISIGSDEALEALEMALAGEPVEVES